MSPSITCHGHFHGDLSSVSASLSSVHHSCLAISSTSSPLGTTSRAFSPLDIVSDEKTSNSSAVEITEITVNDCVSPPVSDLPESSTNMSSDSRLSLSSRKAPNSPDIRPTPKPMRTVPSANSVTPANRRSTSRSTVRSGQASRNSSLHSSRPTVTSTSITPSVSGRKLPAEKRENLIALHREACRIFQSDDSIKRCKPDSQLPHSPTSTVSAYFSPHDGNSPPAGGSAASSPVIRAQPSHSHLERESLDGSPRRTHQPSHVSGYESNAGTRSRQTSATVIDWTSPSTRRREYAKIDRASSGFRGLWRRVAPKWCQGADRRTPFFEEGKNGKANYEGSVRRFRMDIPEETEPEATVDPPHQHFKVLRRKLSGVKADARQKYGKKRRRLQCIPVT
ncbi:hypothetical protein PHISCL_01416 [Aspergillus sclerotialis]|uniref:Uncharacterized protein n=1 Tax=Aspergillus sclerotialis TaxID=2070753 RepID=A0A3A2ZSX7_9EURO|nr:hypothetical protein PHISCL_01416 [Aspergillus sclerotialis]